MKKLTTLILAFACLLTLCACGGEEGSKTEEPKELSLDLAELSASMLEKMGATSPELNENMMLNMYGISADDCAEMKVFSDFDATKCNEIWLLKAKDEAALENVKTLAQNRVDALIAQSQNYNADVYAASQDARIEVRGLYLMLVVTTNGDSSEVAELFLNA